MYLIGGWSSTALDTVFMLDLNQEEPQNWNELKKLSQPLFSSCAINWEGEIIITGGATMVPDSDNQDTVELKNVEVYNAEHENKNLPPMNFARRQHGCSSVEFTSGEKGKIKNFSIIVCPNSLFKLLLARCKSF